MLVVAQGVAGVFGGVCVERCGACECCVKTGKNSKNSKQQTGSGFNSKQGQALVVVLLLFEEHVKVSFSLLFISELENLSPRPLSRALLIKPVTSSLAASRIR